MADNPNVPSLLAKAAAAQKATARLRDAMTQVAAEVKATPPQPAKPASKP